MWHLGANIWDNFSPIWLATDCDSNMIPSLPGDIDRPTATYYWWAYLGHSKPSTLKQDRQVNFMWMLPHWVNGQNVQAAMMGLQYDQERYTFSWKI